jgi:hypothetical protein
VNATDEKPAITDQQIPTAPKTASLTREHLDREIAAAQQHEPYLVGYGGIQAHAF